MTRGGCLRQNNLSHQIEKVSAKDGKGWSKASPNGPLPWSHRIHKPLAGITDNIVEQDHRGGKRVTRPMLGFKSFEAAQDTLIGIELMHMIKKRQLVVEEGDKGRTAAELFYSLAA